MTKQNLKRSSLSKVISGGGRFQYMMVLRQTSWFLTRMFYLLASFFNSRRAKQKCYQPKELPRTLIFNSQGNVGLPTLLQIHFTFWMTKLKSKEARELVHGHISCSQSQTWALGLFIRLSFTTLCCLPKETLSHILRARLYVLNKHFEWVISFTITNRCTITTTLWTRYKKSSTGCGARL